MKATIQKKQTVKYPLSYEDIKEEGWYEESYGQRTLLFLKDTHGELEPCVHCLLSGNSAGRITHKHSWRNFTFRKSDIQVTI